MDVTRLAVTESAICEPTCGDEAGTGSARFKPGLSFKVVSLVVSVSLISVLGAAYLLFNLQRQQLIDNTRSATAALSNTIEANLHHAMLTDDWTMANEVVQAIVAERIVDTVRILDTEGVVGVSSQPNEVGVRFDQTEPTCQSCHAADAPSDDSSTIFAADAGHPALLNVNLIHNEPQWWTCHDPDERILGLLMIETPLAHLQDQLRTGFWRTALLALGTFGLLVLVPRFNGHVNTSAKVSPSRSRLRPTGREMSI